MFLLLNDWKKWMKKVAYYLNKARPSIKAVGDCFGQQECFVSVYNIQYVLTTVDRNMFRSTFTCVSLKPKTDQIIQLFILISCNIFNIAVSLSTIIDCAYSKALQNKIFAVHFGSNLSAQWWKKKTNVSSVSV